MTQHPDEGTLHAYIDGELPRIEAAALETHVADCASCSSALAEARGLVATASRAITALDIGPFSARKPAVLVAGVASDPARGTARRPVFRVSYARAAALLVVVGGTAVVIERSGTWEGPRVSLIESPAPDVPSSGEAVATAPGAGTMAAPTSTPQPIAPAGRSIEATAGAAGPRARAASPRRLAADVASGATTRARLEERAMAPTAAPALVEGQGVDVANSAKRPVTSADSGRSAVVTAVPPPPPRPSEIMRFSEVVVTGAVTSVAQVSRYRTKEGVVVILTEEPLRSDFAEDPTLAGRTAQQSAQRRVAAAAAAPAVSSYRWSSAEKGLRYTLTGPLTVPELEALSKRLSELHRLP